MNKANYLPFTALAIALSLILSPASGISQELRLLPGEVLPKLEDVLVRATVTPDLSGIYRYSYVITNPGSNTGKIRRVEVDIKKPAGGQDLSSEGLSNGPRFLRSTSESVLSTIGMALIPVGLFSPPDWISGLSIDGTAGWASSDASFRIHPAQSLGGFEMTSRGLPGIRSTMVKPKFEQIPVAEATPENTERIKAIEEAITVTLKTIGPTAPPATFVPLEFLNYLITLLHDSRQQGWIMVDGVHQSLLGKLVAAKRKLEAGDTQVAKDTLTAFLNEVRATSCQEFSCPGNRPETSEAYALLFFNGQFLWERLP